MMNKQEKEDKSIKMEIPIEAMDERLVTSEEAIADLLQILGDKFDNINVLTELNMREIVFLTVMEAINSKLNADVLKKFLHLYKEHKVSHKRRGRKELVAVAKRLGGVEEPQGALSRLSRWIRREY